MSTLIHMLRVTCCILAAGALAAPVRAQEPKPEFAAVLAEPKKHNCREIDSGTVTSANKRLTFGCHSNLPDAAFTKLAAFPELEELDFISDKVTDACLGHLKNLPKLRTLHINSSTITDKVLDSLKDLPKLEELLLMRTQVTDQGLAKVQALTGLKSLVLVRLKITPELIEQIKLCEQLDKVYIGQTEFSDEQKRELTVALPNLSINKN